MYVLEFPSNFSNTNNILGENESGNYDFLDAKTGIEIDGNKAPAGGKLKLCVFPALVKVIESGEKMRLAKAMVILEQ